MGQKTIQNLSSAGRHQECLKACQQLLQGEPENPLPWKYAGKSLIALGQLEKAQHCLTEAHQLDPTDPETAKEMGNIFLRKENQITAEQWYKEALKIDGKYAPAINNLANIKRKRGNNKEAIDLFKQVIEIDPRLAQPYAGAAECLLNLGDLEKAESLAIQALKINGNIPGTNEILGKIYQKRSNPKEAIEYYKKEILINSKSITSLLNLGVLLLQEGKPEAAIKSLLEAAAINPSEQGSLLLAQAYQKIDKPKQAINEYRKLDMGKCKDKLIPFNLGLCLLKTGNNLDAAEAFRIATSLDESFIPAWGNIGTALMKEGRLQEALKATQKVLELAPDNPTAHMNLGGIYKDLGDLDQALSATLKSLELKPNSPNALMNLGGIYKNLGNLDQALSATLKSLELKPNSPNALMNLGGIYKNLGNLDQALSATLQSLEIEPENPNTLMNLGSIYQDMGDLDQALSLTLRSLDLKANNPGAINNIKVVIDQLNLIPSNAENITRAYELLLNQTDVSHRKLSKIFLQAFLPTIQKASAREPIISESNQEFKILAADWRFRKSLTLMIPPNPEAEIFFTRLRKELLKMITKENAIASSLKPLTEALAAQCHLNEYVYSISKEEEESVAILIKKATKTQESTNNFLAIIGCYKAINKTGINPESINNYPTTDYSSKELISTQFKAPYHENQIKNSFQNTRNITNTVSQDVRGMYEENPYPRFKYSDFTAEHLSKTVSSIIRNETSKKNISFPEELSSPNARPMVLIAGCGTGNQVIVASRYKNAAITAIDLSTSSIAYAIRKTYEYQMNNVTFRRTDLLNSSELGDTFDVIECSGVLHHMEQPAEGLAVLVEHLKPGGYIKLGLYSEAARNVIVKAREIIQALGIKGTPTGIREFRQKVLNGEIKELLDLPNFAHDFYSLSECRDLCFHIQEHRFNSDSLKKLLDSHSLSFCGFIVSEEAKKVYREQYPEDIDMTSLKNWGELEAEYPSTFSSMYQFWAQKQF